MSEPKPNRVGRRAMAPKDRRINLTVRVLPEVYRYIKTLPRGRVREYLERKFKPKKSENK